jgi:site-specific DNA-cytosine methylase
LIDELPILTPYQVLDARHFSPQRRKRVFVGRFPRVRRIGNDELLQDRLRRGPYRMGPRAADRKPQRSRTFTRETTLGAWPADKAPTVLSQCSRRDAECVVVDDSLPSGQRQFEWQESASLQGFPDDYVFYGSPTDVAKMVGRAIQIDLGRTILEAICRSAGAEIPTNGDLVEA